MINYSLSKAGRDSELGKFNTERKNSILPNIEQKQTRNLHVETSLDNEGGAIGSPFKSRKMTKTDSPQKLDALRRMGDGST